MIGDSGDKPQELPAPARHEAIENLSKKSLQDLAESEKLREVIQDLSKAKQAKILGFLAETSLTTYSGPLPPPEMLREYGSVLKFGPEKIFEIFEKQANHRMSLEKFGVEEPIKLQGRGQVFAFILTISGLGGAMTLALLGHEVAAIALVGAVFGVTGVYGLLGKMKRKEQAEKELDAGKGSVV